MKFLSIKPFPGGSEGSIVLISDAQLSVNASEHGSWQGADVGIGVSAVWRARLNQAFKIWIQSIPRPPHFFLNFCSITVNQGRICLPCFPCLPPYDSPPCYLPPCSSCLPPLPVPTPSSCIYRGPRSTFNWQSPHPLLSGQQLLSYNTVVSQPSIRNNPNNNYNALLRYSKDGYHHSLHLFKNDHN